MENKWALIVNGIVFVIIIIFLTGFIWKYSIDEIPEFEEECVEVNTISSFSYDACYDAYSKKIFLKVKRGQDSFDISSMDFSFFDLSAQDYNLDEVPSLSGTESYSFPAEKNPQNIEVVLNAIGVRGVACEDPLLVFVKYCPVLNNEETVGAEVSPLDGTSLDNYIDVEGLFDYNIDSDIFFVDLADRESVWESYCKSSWDCDEWSSCEEGVERRECVDAEGCVVSTKAPITVRYCDGRCVENWECTWSDCRSGSTVPICADLNKCGTSENRPTEIDCGQVDECSPDVNCGEWSECEVNYGFLDLIGNSINSLEGARSRICIDANSCVGSSYQSESCSVGIDVYTNKFTKCGRNFIGIYNLLDDKLVARVDEGTVDNPRLDIYFENGEENSYCDYCFDGQINGDEEGVDCGGSCEACAIKYSS